MLPDVIDICWVDLDAAAPDVLDDAERARAARFAHAREGRRWAAARAALRAVLGERLGLEPALVRFTYGPRGKPAAEGVRFNLSHAGPLALIAVSGEREV